LRVTFWRSLAAADYFFRFSLIAAHCETLAWSKNHCTFYQNADSRTAKRQILPSLSAGILTVGTTTMNNASP
jgi:hypothetical protein